MADRDNKDWKAEAKGKIEDTKDHTRASWEQAKGKAEDAKENVTDFFRNMDK